MKEEKKRKQPFLNSNECEWLMLILDVYEKGASEQKQIDIEKACKWLKKLGVFSMLSFNDEEGVSQEVYEDMFRKVMEE